MRVEGPGFRVCGSVCAACRVGCERESGERGTTGYGPLDLDALPVGAADRKGGVARERKEKTGAPALTAGANRLFQLLGFVPQVARFRRAPVQIKEVIQQRVKGLVEGDSPHRGMARERKQIKIAWMFTTSRRIPNQGTGKSILLQIKDLLKAICCKSRNL